MNFYDVLLAKKLGGSGGGGGDTPTGTKQITENGTYNVASYASAAVNVPASAVDSGTKNITENGNNQDVTGYAAVNVNVPNTYAAGDEGKVVSSGELVSQGSQNIDQNGTYDTTLKNSVTVNVSGGGDSPAVPTPLKGVVFVDYDGTILHDYTKEEFLSLSEMPANPSHAGLTAQGWNWSYSDARTYVTNNGALCIGQQYITSDGKTKIYLTLNEISLPVPLNIGFYTSVKGGATIDWGDGNTTVTTANANAQGVYSHQYSTAGDYVISIEVTDGDIKLGYNGSNHTFFGLGGLKQRAAQCVKKIEIGDDVAEIYRQAFVYAQNIETITIPKNVKLQANTTIFQNCLRLKAIVVPENDGTSLPGIAANCNVLKFVSIPKNYTSRGTNISVASNNKLLRMLTVPALTDMGTGALADDCKSVEILTMPGTYTSIPGNFARYLCNTNKDLTIPATVTSIADYAFSESTFNYHLLPTTPPTLANQRGMGTYADWTKIYVPYSADHSVLTAYQTASNWSNFASMMEEEPQ